MKLIVFLLFFINISLASTKCFEPFDISFSDEEFFLRNMHISKLKDKDYYEIDFENSYDESFLITKKYFFYNILDFNKTVKNIKKNKNYNIKNFSFNFLFEKKDVNGKFKIYKVVNKENSNEKTIIINILDKNDKLFANVVFSRMSKFKKIGKVIDSLKINKYNCSKKDLWKEYKKLHTLELNKKYKILLMLYLKNNNDKKTKNELKRVINAIKYNIGDFIFRDKK